MVKNKKSITLDDLARMVAQGFEHVETRMDDFDKRFKVLTETVQNLTNKLGHYIDIHEERYLDLKRRYRSLAKWAERVASKTGIPLELEE